MYTKESSTYSAESFANFMENVVRITALRIPEALKDIWSEVRSVADIGGGSGYVLMELCRRYPQLQGIDIDLPELEPVFNKYLERESSIKEGAQNLKERIFFQALDIFKEDFKFKISGKKVEVDAIILGNVIHDWEDEKKLLLLKKAYAALKPGGRIIVYEAFIDDEERLNTPSFIMSLNMQMVCKGNQVTYKQFNKWLTDVGFVNIETRTIDTCHDVIIGVKKE